MRTALSPHHSKRKSGIDCIVIHHTGTLGTRKGAAVRWFKNPDSKVSAHYVIERAGEIVNCVFDDKKAWHAGRSTLFGRRNVNDFSIGIELVGDGNKRRYAPEQMKSLIWLVNHLRDMYRIQRNRIVGHQDISPGRKVDPGKFFPWYEFLEALEISLWDEKS